MTRLFNINLVKNCPRLAICITALLFTACASNDELFAQYDEGCYLATGPEGLAVIAADTSMPWEPAIYFGYARHELVASERQRLKANIAVMRKYPGLRLSLQAFTDEHGSQSYNRRLANQRVRAVAQELVYAGIPVSRMHVAPLGEELPLAAGSGVQSRILNRRVEMMLLDSRGLPLLMRVNGDTNSGFTPPGPVR